MTWRKLGILLDWLPGESATKTAIRDALGDDTLAELAQREPVGYGPWSHEALRLASLEDAVNRLTWVMIRLQGDPKAKVPQPEPVRRPGIAGKTRKRGVLSDEGRAYLNHLRNNQGALPPGYRAVAVGGR